MTLTNRLEEAKGASRELDAALYNAAFGANRCLKFPHTNEPCDANGNPLPQFTASIDAALALVERVGFRLIKTEAHWLGNPKNKSWRYDAFVHEENGPAAEWATCIQTLPLAICLALLKALQHKDTGNE